MTELKYLGQTTLKTPLKKKYMPESEQRGAVLEKKIRKYSRINNSPFHLKKTSNGPVYLANHDLWLPNMVSK